MSGARQTDERQPRIVVEQQAGKPIASAIPSPGRPSCRTRRAAPGHVVGDARHQAASGLRREECGRLSEHVAEQQVAQVADDALPDIGHQVRTRHTRQSLWRIDDEDRDDVESQPLALGSTLSRIGLTSAASSAIAAP